MTILGIDIGGTNVRIGLVREDHGPDGFEKVPTASVFRSGWVLEELTDFLKGFAAGRPFDAVTIGFPATLDRQRSKVIQAPNIPFMEALPVRRPASDLYGR